MDCKKEKELIFLILVLIIVIDIAFMVQTINNDVFYISLISITMITFFALLYVMMLDKTTKEKELAKILYYDINTGLPNKNKFLNDLALKLKSKEKYAVIVFGMRNFKEMANDNNMVEVNKYLKFVSAILKKETKENELCANIANEYFALLYSYKFPTELIARVKSISSEVTQYNPNLKIDLSFGIYCINDKRFSANLIFNKADLARQSVVDKKDALYAFYDNIANDDNQSLDMEIYMEESLASNRFIVCYQPKYRINRKRLIGFEALVRWNHPRKGILFPAKFLPIFESNGFIKKLDIYVLEEVCKNINKWHEKKMAIYPISVNISKNSLRSKSFLTDINDVFIRYGIDKKLIEFEISEETAFEDINFSINIINKLKELELVVSIDDFAASSSSISVIDKLPIDILKIDRQFLEATNKKGKAIIANMIKLAHQLNIKVLVEKIERKTELKVLKDLNCDYGQGYYYSKPLTKKETTSLLRNKHKK